MIMIMMIIYASAVNKLYVAEAMLVLCPIVTCGVIGSAGKSVTLM